MKTPTRISRRFRSERVFKMDIQGESPFAEPARGLNSRENTYPEPVFEPAVSEHANNLKTPSQSHASPGAVEYLRHH